MAPVAVKRTRAPAVRPRPVALEYPREWLPPCLAGETGEIPTGARWVHELKFDGYRTQLHLPPDRTLLYSRNGHDWIDRYASLAEALRKLPANHAVLDAETVVPFPDGRCDFWTLQPAASQQEAA